MRITVLTSDAHTKPFLNVFQSRELTTRGNEVAQSERFRADVLGCPRVAMRVHFRPAPSGTLWFGDKERLDNRGRVVHPRQTVQLRSVSITP